MPSFPPTHLRPTGSKNHYASAADPILSPSARGAVGAGLAFCPGRRVQLDALSGKFQGGGGDAAKVTVKATIEPAAANRPARLVIVAQVAPGWHIYSITQPDGGPIRSKIKLPPSTDFRLLGDFAVDPPAAVHQYNDIWPDLKVEEHSGKVTWQAPIELAPGVDPAKLEIAGAVNAQACAETCIPPKDYKFVARLAAGSVQAGAAPAPMAPGQGGRFAAVPVAPTGEIAGPPAGPERHLSPGTTPEAFKAAHAAIRGRIEPATVAPGGQARLILTAQPEAPWYIYALAEFDPDEPGSPKPTLIEMEPAHSLKFGRPSASSEPSSKSIDGMPIRYYSREVSWTIPIRVPSGQQPGDYVIAGLIGFMTCKDGSCDLPTAVRFTGLLRVADRGGAAAMSLGFAPAKYDEAQAAGHGANGRQSGGGVRAVPPLPDIAPTSTPGAAEAGHRRYEIVELNTTRATTLPMTLLFSFLGGPILNVMPCVLPVIGLKVLSFVEQGGQKQESDCR